MLKDEIQFRGNLSNEKWNGIQLKQFYHLNKNVLWIINSFMI